MYYARSKHLYGGPVGSGHPLPFPSRFHFHRTSTSIGLPLPLDFHFHRTSTFTSLNLRMSKHDFMHLHSVRICLFACLHLWPADSVRVLVKLKGVTPVELHISKMLDVNTRQSYLIIILYITLSYLCFKSHYISFLIFHLSELEFQNE